MVSEVEFLKGATCDHCEVGRNTAANTCDSMTACHAVHPHTTVTAIGGEWSGRHCRASDEGARGEEDKRDTAPWDGSGRNLREVDGEWLDKFERMGRRAFPYEHAEREKKEKRLAAKKKKKQTKIRRYMQRAERK